MATHDYIIDNSTGANVRADINSVLQAILTNNSSSSAPSTTAAYMFWADTTSGTLKIRNSSDNAWVELLQLDGTLTLEDGSVSAPALAFRDDLDTGIFSSAQNTINFATAGVERMELGTSLTVFNEDGANVDFRIESDSVTHMFYLDAGNNRIGIGESSPSKTLVINENDSECVAIIKSSDTGTAGLFLGGQSDEIKGGIIFDNSTDALTLQGHNNAEALRVDSSGKLSTNGETAPDVSDGGLCLNQGVNDTNILTFKSSDIAHGCTTFDETDTYFSARKSSGNKGGVRLHAFTDAAGADPAFEFHGIIGSDADASYVPFEFRGHELNGTGTNNIATDRRIAKFTNSDGSIIASVTGTGITFGSNHSTSNALDFYEEGTWTPVFQNNSVNGGTFPVSTYIRVGRLVSIAFHATVGGGTGSSGFKVTGLPFAPDKNGVAPVATNCNISCFARIFDSSDRFEVQKFDSTDVTYQNLSDKFVMINATYRCNP